MFVEEGGETDTFGDGVDLEERLAEPEVLEGVDGFEDVGFAGRGHGAVAADFVLWVVWLVVCAW